MRARLAAREAVIRRSARELTAGLTSASGSQPLWNVVTAATLSSLHLHFYMLLL